MTYFLFLLLRSVYFKKWNFFTRTGNAKNLGRGLLYQNLGLVIRILITVMWINLIWFHWYQIKLIGNERVLIIFLKFWEIGKLFDECFLYFLLVSVVSPKAHQEQFIIISQYILVSYLFSRLQSLYLNKMIPTCKVLSSYRTLSNK